MLSKLKNTAYTLAKKWFGLVSTDLTSNLPDGAVLVVAPHPDDETIGCGAAIARFCDEKRKVHVLVVTDGRRSAKSDIITPDALVALRRQEALNATKKLGLPEGKVSFLNFEDGKTEPFIGGIYRDIGAHIALLSPTIIFAPHPFDEHKDHRAIAAIVGRLQDEGKFSGIVLHYPIWYRIAAWPYGLLRCLLSPTMLMNCRRLDTERYLGQKTEALREYRSQFENLTGEKEWSFFSKTVFERFSGSEIFFERKKRN